jgi:branched-subunit amino acid transport protein
VRFLVYSCFEELSEPSTTAVCQILAMSLIVHLWRTWDYPAFENASLSEFAAPYLIVIPTRILTRLSGDSFFINLGSWILDVLISIGVATTGLAANAGHAWAAGGRAYRPIPDHAN